MRVSRFFQFFLGVTLAAVTFFGGLTLLGFLMMYRMWGQPPRPTFANDDPNFKTKQLAEAKAKAKAKAKAAQSSPNATAKATPKPTATAQASATPTPKPTATLEPGAYEATVTWPEGLSIRSEPTFDAETTGGVEANAPVVVLENSSDGAWQKIRVKATGEKGWIKAGNTEKASGTNPETSPAASPAEDSPEAGN